MPNEYIDSVRLQKGALIRLDLDFLALAPNIIVFQYNPTEMTRELSPFTGTGGKKTPGMESTWGENLATDEQPYDPGESFKLKLEFDAADSRQYSVINVDKMMTGVADRIAALEMLLYPQGEDGLSNKILEKLNKKSAVPKGRVPMVLFVWGPGRIVPVRLTAFSVTEQAFSPELYPIRATVDVGLAVLSDSAITKMLKFSGSVLSPLEEFAVKAYQFTRLQKETLARRNMLSNIDVSSLLPF